MANTTSKLRISELDFDQLNASLKAFLKDRSEYTDWDFEGSNLSLLLEILAYNTHYLSFYLNMVGNEMFLDSADLRESIVSHAKHVGYTPVSRKAATAVVDVTIDPSPDAPATIVIDKGTIFTSTIDGVSYPFVNMDAFTIVPALGVYTASSLTIKQGTLYTLTFAVDYSQRQRFIIPTDKIDTSTITVTVQNSSVDSTTESFTLMTEFNTLTGESPVYFLQEVENRWYELYFGDGVVGKKLTDGNIVRIEYLITDGELANKSGNGSTASTKFAASSTIEGYGDITVTTVDAAYGGAERETVESIKFTAPQNFETQNRAVTVPDYKTILKREYPNADSIAIWGGEDNDPPIYGKVFISIKPVAGFVLTNNTKNDITQNILSKYNVVSILPTIVDPEYLYLTVNSTVKYNYKITQLSSDAIKSLVITDIQNFVDTNISKFDSTFRYSQLLYSIDTAEKSILSNVTSIKMRKEKEVRLGSKDRYEINFNNPIRPGTLNSNAFVVTEDAKIAYNVGDKHYIQDNGTGRIQIYKIFQSNRLVVKEDSGTIDYTTGKIVLTNFIPNTIDDGSVIVKLTCEPLNTDIIPSRNDIITVVDSDISVTMVSEIV